MSTRAKGTGSKDCVLDGADEIDMVINIGALKDKDYDVVLEYQKAVKEACSNVLLKSYNRTCLLTTGREGEGMWTFKKKPIPIL